MDSSQRHLVIGVASGAASAVFVALLVVAVLLFRQRYREKKKKRRTRAPDHVYRRRRYASTSSAQYKDDTQTPPGTAFHSNSFASISGVTNGANYMDMRNHRSHRHPYPTPQQPPTRGLPLPRGPTPLVDMPYRDSRLPSSEIHYALDGRIHFPQATSRDSRMLVPYERESFPGAGRYPFHKRDSYEYGRYMSSSYGRVSSEPSSSVQERIDEGSRSGFTTNGRYNAFDKWPSWSRDDVFDHDPRNVYRLTRSDATSSHNDGEWTDADENGDMSNSNTDSHSGYRSYRWP